MTKSTYGPGIEKAIEFVRKRLDSGIWSIGERLPSTRALARSIGISQRSMTKAVAELKRLGLLHGVKGGCLRAGTPDASGESTGRAPQGFWQIKRAELERDILAGIYAETGGLPLPKELQVRYGVGYRTLRKILVSLVKSDVVWMRGKTYELPSASMHMSANRIIFITPHFSFPARSALNPEEYPLIDRLERECLRRGLRLEVMELDFNSPKEILLAIGSSMVREQSLGFVLDVWWMDHWRTPYETLLDKLAQLKKPVAIVDEWGEYRLAPNQRSNSLMQVFQIEGRGAGMRMAKLLLNLGHRSIAYISLTPDSSWSKNRLAGIMEHYSAAGLEKRVQTFCDQSEPDYLNHIMVLAGFGDTLIEKIVAIGQTRQQGARRFQLFLEQKRTIFPGNFAVPEVNRLREILAPLVDAVQGSAKGAALESVNEMVIKKANACIAPMLLAPIFEKALACRNITAWVCASDITALDALQFLDKKKIGIPYRLSVAGFDNIPLLTAARRLTSFDFNAQSFAYQMVDFIVRPPKLRGAFKHVAIEVKGTIIERGTTGQARETKSAAVA